MNAEQRQTAADLWTKALGQRSKAAAWHCSAFIPSREPVNSHQADGLEPYARLYAARNHIRHRHLLLLSPKADTHFTIPQRVEG